MKNLTSVRLGIVLLLFISPVLQADVKPELKKSYKEKCIQFCLVFTALSATSYAVFKVCQAVMKNGKNQESKSFEKDFVYHLPRLMKTDRTYTINVVNSITGVRSDIPLERPCIFYSHQRSGEKGKFDGIATDTYRILWDDEHEILNFSTIQKVLREIDPSLKNIIVGVEVERVESKVNRFIIDPESTSSIKVKTIEEALKEYRGESVKSCPTMLILIPRAYVPVQIVS